MQKAAWNLSCSSLVILLTPGVKIKPREEPSRSGGSNWRLKEKNYLSVSRAGPGGVLHHHTSHRACSSSHGDVLSPGPSPHQAKGLLWSAPGTCDRSWLPVTARGVPALSWSLRDKACGAAPRMAPPGTSENLGLAQGLPMAEFSLRTLLGKLLPLVEV